MKLERISTPTDERLADYRALADPVLRRAWEPGAGVFIAEGRLVVGRLLGSRYPVRSVLVTQRGLDALRSELEGRDVSVYLVSAPVAESVTGYDVHRGILAAAGRLPLPAAEDLVAGGATVLVLENLTDQANLGAVFRNGAALGADAVLLSPRCCDPLYRRSVRVSMGAVLALPFAYAGSWPGDLGALGAHGLTTVALTPNPRAMPIEDLAGALAPGARVALAVGSEGPGLSEGALGACDLHVRIPMEAGVDSLNVATAAAVALHCLRVARVSRSSGDP